MKNCIFCQIGLNPALESHRVIYRDDKYLAMLVLHPETKGHFIVFPKTHSSELLEMTDRGEFFELVVELAEKFMKKAKAKAYVLKLNNKLYKLEDNPMHVGHIHMHVVLRYMADDRLV